jgi:hypothetical protein
MGAGMDVGEFEIHLLTHVGKEVDKDGNTIEHMLIVDAVEVRRWRWNCLL